METLIIAGGFYNIGLVIFHLLFWRLFSWDTDLESLTVYNKAIMQVLNISLIIVFVIFAYISFKHSHELVTTPLGNTLLLLMALFWMARTVQQILFFKLAHWISGVFLFLFVTGSLLYGIPALQSLHIRL
jgi:hypothetical protein